MKFILTIRPASSSSATVPESTAAERFSWRIPSQDPVSIFNRGTKGIYQHCAKKALAPICRSSSSSGQLPEWLLVSVTRNFLRVFCCGSVKKATQLHVIRQTGKGKAKGHYYRRITRFSKAKCVIIKLHASIEEGESQGDRENSRKWSGVIGYMSDEINVLTRLGGILHNMKAYSGSTDVLSYQAHRVSVTGAQLCQRDFQKASPCKDLWQR